MFTKVRSGADPSHVPLSSLVSPIPVIGSLFL